jgi:hypothetical protein
MSGIEIALARGESVRILTLTSSPQSRDPRRAFRAFVKRARRRYGVFEYCLVQEKTQSGLIHYHLLYRGRYMGHRWVSETWRELNGAPVVYIQRFRGGKSRLAGYLVKYLGKELGGYRSWWSWGWVFRGFVKVWKYLVKVYKEKALVVWKAKLKAIALGLDLVPPPTWKLVFQIALPSPNLPL